MVLRFKVAFIREILLLVRETGRFVLYPEDSQITQESRHVCRRCIRAFMQVNVSVINCKLVAHLHAYSLIQKKSSEQATEREFFQ